MMTSTGGQPVRAIAALTMSGPVSSGPHRRMRSWSHQLFRAGNLQEAVQLCRRCGAGDVRASSGRLATHSRRSRAPRGRLQVRKNSDWRSRGGGHRLPCPSGELARCRRTSAAACRAHPMRGRTRESHAPATFGERHHPTRSLGVLLVHEGASTSKITARYTSATCRYGRRARHPVDASS